MSLEASMELGRKTSLVEIVLDKLLLFVLLTGNVETFWKGNKHG